MVLVEKEKKGHSHTSTRHPTLSDEKKAKLKAFTKEYSHKLLKKLKEKGKLRRIASSTKSNGSMSTPQTFSTPSRIPPDTPTGSEARHEEEAEHDDLLDEMFGDGDVDGDGEGEVGMEVDEDEDEEGDPSPPVIATPDGEVVVSPVVERKGMVGFPETPGRTPLDIERDERG